MSDKNQESKEKTVTRRDVENQAVDVAGQFRSLLEDLNDTFGKLGASLLNWAEQREAIMRARAETTVVDTQQPQGNRKTSRQ